MIDDPTTYSVVIPVYNSEKIVGKTIDRVEAFFDRQGWPLELILVNDGSPDNVWGVLQQKSEQYSNIIAINLLRNYGQHTAVFCGLQHSNGDWVITLDDDLQNPPEEIVHLVTKANEGDHDVVYGQFHEKQHPGYRRLGSRLIREVNRRIFHQPPDLILSNYRLIHRDVVDRICQYNTRQPYITGLTVMFAANPANAKVKHQEREVGTSNYTTFRIIKLVMRLLFNYSSWPLRMVSMIGILISFLSFIIGLYFLGKRLLGEVQVPGWTSVIVLLALFNGISLLILGMLGEYVIRLLNESSTQQPYHIRETLL